MPFHFLSPDASAEERTVQGRGHRGCCGIEDKQFELRYMGELEETPGKWSPK